MLNTTLEKPVYIEVKLSSDRVFKADLSQELGINTSNIMDEIIKQPSKYAKWATLVDLAEIKVKRALDRVEVSKVIGDGCFDDRVREYMTAYEQLQLLRSAKEAFNHRKTALLELLDNPDNPYVLKNYHSKISRALETTVS